MATFLRLFIDMDFKKAAIISFYLKSSINFLRSLNDLTDRDNRT